jgi:hypothetical protein
MGKKPRRYLDVVRLYHRTPSSRPHGPYTKEEEEHHGVMVGLWNDMTTRERRETGSVRDAALTEKGAA